MRSPDRRLKASLRLQKEGAVGERGFTLIETSVALLLMMVVGLSSVSLFLYSIRNNSGASDRALAAAVAQQELEKLRSVSFTDASLNATAGTTTTVASAGRPYTVLKVVCNTSACGGDATLKVITITVTPQGAGPAWTRSPVTITTLRSTSAQGTN